ncbi:MAG: ShlB/FhaC/HecB family hemolysin secretion/activation protein [bacterium]
MKKIKTTYVKAMVLALALGVQTSALAADGGTVPAQFMDPAANAMQRGTQQRQAYEGKQQVQAEQEQSNLEVEKNQTETAMDQVSFEVREIRLNRSALLSEEEIRQAVDFSGPREMTLNELQQVVARINVLYQQKGQLTAMAVLPPQEVTDGVVEIHLVEGRYGKTTLRGNKRIAEKYVMDRVNTPSGQLCDLKLLQKDLNLYNQSNTFLLQAKLVPGDESGTTDVQLTLQERDNPWNTILFADNANQDTSGLYRFGFVSQYYGFGKVDDRMLVSSSWTNGTLSGFISYDTPISVKGTRATFSYSRNRVKINHGDFKTMDIMGHSNDVSVSLSHPVHTSVSSKGEVFSEVHHKWSDTTYLGDIVLSDFDTDVFKLGYNLRSFDERGMWFGQLSFSGFSSDNKVNDDHIRGSYQNIYLLRRQNVGQNTYLLWRTLAQNSSCKDLPASEQITLGGMSTLRGYDESALSGYKGWVTGLEYNLPLTKDPQLLRGLTFVDYGQVYQDYGMDETKRSHLCSVGVGLECNYLGWSGRILVGMPLSTSDNVPHSKIRTHFYFQKSI